MAMEESTILGITIALIIVALYMLYQKQAFASAIGPLSIVSDSARRPLREPYVSLPVAPDTYALPAVFNGIFNRIPTPEITHRGIIASSNRRADELSLAAIGM